MLSIKKEKTRSSWAHRGTAGFSTWKLAVILLTAIVLSIVGGISIQARQTRNPAKTVDLGFDIVEEGTPHSDRGMDKVNAKPASRHSVSER